MITAKCKRNIDPLSEEKLPLIVGLFYKVTHIDMGSSFTTITLEGNRRFNSVLFDFFEDGKPIDIYKDKRFNPYLKKQESTFEELVEKAVEHYQKALSADNSCKVRDCAEELTTAIAYTTKALADLNKYLERAIKVMK